MSVRDRLLARMADQLGNPHGALGRLTGRLLNRGNKAAMASAIDAVNPQPSEVLADLGFGGGEGLAQLLAKVAGAGSVVGIDQSATMVNAARRRFRAEVAAGRLRLHEGRLEKLPLPEHSIDAAISVNTVYFVADLDLLFQELVRVLRPGGRLALGVGDPDAMKRMPFSAHGFILRPIDDIVAAARSTGLALADRRMGEDSGSYHILVGRLDGSASAPG